MFPDNEPLVIFPQTKENILTLDIDIDISNPFF